MIIIFGIVFIVFTYFVIRSGRQYTGPVCKHCDAPVYYNRNCWVHFEEFENGHKAVPYMRIEK